MFPVLVSMAALAAVTLALRARISVPCVPALLCKLLITTLAAVTFARTALSLFSCMAALAVRLIMAKLAAEILALTVAKMPLVDAIVLAVLLILVAKLPTTQSYTVCSNVSYAVAKLDIT